jgi:hypothetical protein
MTYVVLDNGVERDATEEEIAEIEARAAVDIDALKAARWEEIKQHRDKRELAGFQLGERWFHSDVTSQIKYLGLKDNARDVLAAGGSLDDPIMLGGQQITWHSLDNVDVPVTARLAFDLVASVKLLQGTVFTLAKQHRAAMEASAAPASYDFSAGWPAIYVEA